MRSKMLIFVFFMCFAAVNGFSLGGNDKNNQQEVDIVKTDIAELKTELKKMQENTSWALESIDQKLLSHISGSPEGEKEQPSGSPVSLPHTDEWNDRFLRPITWENVLELEKDLDKLPFYVSRDLILIPKEQNSSHKVVSDDEKDAANDMNKLSEERFFISSRTEVKNAKLFRSPSDKESIEIFFSDQFALLKFVRNVKNDFFELEDVTIKNNPGEYTFDNEKDIPLLCIYDEPGNNNKIPPPRTPGPQTSNNSSSGTSRPSISGDMPVMVKSGQSNYLKQTAVVEYLNQFRGIPRNTINAIVGQYMDEAQKLGINHDIAIVQMCHATEFLTNNLWKTNNYANLSKDSAIWKGKSWNGTFPNSRAGVKAHIMHLKGYASTERLEGEAVDPRFHKLSALRGNAKTLHELCRFWAGKEPEKYEASLKNKLENLYDFQEKYNQSGITAGR
jgi:hypothetical protein